MLSSSTKATILGILRQGTCQANERSRTVTFLRKMDVLFYFFTYFIFKLSVFCLVSGDTPAAMKDANLVSLQVRVAKITLFRACFLTVAILCSRVLTRKQRELKIFAMRLNVELADVNDNLQYKIIDPQSNNRRLCSGSSACV